MTIRQIQEEIIDEFSMFDDWMQRYEYIIDLGKSLPIIDDVFKTENNLIKGCQSKVWLHSEVENNTFQMLSMFSDFKFLSFHSKLFMIEKLCSTSTNVG